MNPEVKTIWLNALRSGTYHKGMGRLFERGRGGAPDCHCALGVLAEEAAKAGVIELNEEAESNERFGPVEVDRLLPESVAAWAGFGDFDDEEIDVMRANDSDHPGYDPRTFERAIEVIENEV